MITLSGDCRWKFEVKPAQVQRLHPAATVVKSSRAGPHGPDATVAHKQRDHSRSAVAPMHEAVPLLPERAGEIAAGELQLHERLLVSERGVSESKSRGTRWGWGRAWKRVVAVRQHNAGKWRGSVVRTCTPIFTRRAASGFGLRRPPWSSVSTCALTKARVAVGSHIDLSMQYLRHKMRL